MLEILFFGRVADVMSMRRLEWPASTEGVSLWALRDQVFADAVLQGRVELPLIRMSLNQVVTFENECVKPGDEIAFFSMFSGG